MASRGTSETETLQSTLILGGVDDAVAAYSGQVGGFESSPSKKRLIGLETQDTWLSLTFVIWVLIKAAWLRLQLSMA